MRIEIITICYEKKTMQIRDFGTSFWEPKEYV